MGLGCVEYFVEKRTSCNYFFWELAQLGHADSHKRAGSGRPDKFHGCWVQGLRVQGMSRTVFPKDLASPVARVA